MNYRKQLADNIFNSIPFYWWIQNKGAKELVDGGESIVVPLLYAVNSTVAAYSGYEVINTTPLENFLGGVKLRYLLEYPNSFLYHLGENKEDETMDNQQVTREEIAWLAGIWDGEGTIGVRHCVKIHQFSPRMHVTNSDARIIARVREILEKMGINPYLREHGIGGFPGSKKQTWVIGVDTLAKSKIILDNLLPYLVGKKEQAEFLLRFVNSRLQNFDRGKSNRYRKYKEEDFENIDKIYEANGNQRGILRDYKRSLFKKDDIVQS
jgi:hypothetical protein